MGAVRSFEGGMGLEIDEFISFIYEPVFQGMLIHHSLYPHDASFAIPGPSPPPVLVSAQLRTFSAARTVSNRSTMRFTQFHTPHLLLPFQSPNDTPGVSEGTLEVSFWSSFVLRTPPCL